MNQTLWVPGKLPNLNDMIAAAKGARGRGYLYSKMKKEWTSTVSLLAKAAGLTTHTGPVRVHFVYHEETKRRDLDGVSGGARKLILDGLVDAGVLPNDGPKHVVGLVDEVVYGAGKPGVLVVIEPVEVT